MQKNTVSSIDELGKYLNNIHFFSELNIERVGIFGSFARGETANDIDLLLEDHVDYEALISIKRRMEKDLNKKPDFVIRKFANPIILYRAEKVSENMLPDIKNDLLHCLSISESVGKIKLYSENCQSAESLYDLNEQLNFNASLNLLANIGERISKLSAELRNKYQHIDWQKIRSFRNRIAHDYTGLNIFITFKIITDDLPELQQTMYELIADELNTGTFDPEEYYVAKKSQYNIC